MITVSAILIWIIGCLTMGIIGSAAYVAVFVHDHRQRQDAYKVLKLALGAITGSSGLLVLLVKLHEAGLL